MRPIDIEVLLHYYTRADDFRQGDFTAPAVRELIDSFREKYGLLEHTPEGVGGRSAYRLTERGKFYIEALLAVPLPVSKWIIPDIAA